MLFVHTDQFQSALICAVATIMVRICHVTLVSTLSS